VRIVYLLLAIVGSNIRGYALAPQSKLGAISETVTLASTFSPIHQEPIWTSAGFILLVRAEKPTATHPLGWVQVYAPDGSERGRLVPTHDVPNLIRFAVYSGDVSPRGLVALAGVAVPSAGNRYSTILLYNSSGVFIRRIGDEGRAYFDVAFDEQENICAFSVDRRAMDEGNDYSTVVRYSPDGHKLGGFLLRSLLPSQVEVGDEGSNIGGRFSFGRTPRGVYVFIPQTQQYIESDFSSRILTSAAPVKPDLGVGGDTESQSRSVQTYADRVVVDSSGRVYCVFQQDYSVTGSAGSRFGVFRLKDPGMQWELLSEVTNVPAPGRLIGVKSDKLVFLCSDDGIVWKLRVVNVDNRPSIN